MQIVALKSLTTQPIPSTIDLLAIQSHEGLYTMYSPNHLKNRSSWRKINNRPCSKEVVIEQGLKTQFINIEGRF